MAILWLALVSSNSRGGILAMLGQSMFLALFWKSGRKTLSEDVTKAPERPAQLRRIVMERVSRVLLAGSLVTIVGIGVVWVGGDSLMHRLEFLPRELNTETATRENSTRLAIWEATLGMIRDHPVAGVGFGGYRISLPKYHDASGRWSPQEAHNDYLELIASGGVIAVTLMLVFVVSFIQHTRRCLATASNPLRRAYCFGAQVGLFGVAIHSFLDFGLHITVNAVVCVVLVVIATRIIPSSQDTEAASNLVDQARYPKRV
jgi:O-antigen ligase